MSPALAGWIAHRFGYSVAFVALGIVAAIGLLTCRFGLLSRMHPPGSAGAPLAGHGDALIGHSRKAGANRSRKNDGLPIGITMTESSVVLTDFVLACRWHDEPDPASGGLPGGAGLPISLAVPTESGAVASVLESR